MLFIFFQSFILPSYSLLAKTQVGFKIRLSESRALNSLISSTCPGRTQPDGGTDPMQMAALLDYSASLPDGDTHISIQRVVCSECV